MNQIAYQKKRNLVFSPFWPKKGEMSKFRRNLKILKNMVEMIYKFVLRQFGSILIKI